MTTNLEKLPMLKESDKIKHLYSRMGFGLSPSEWIEKKENIHSKEVAYMFSQSKNMSKNKVFSKDVADAYVKNEKAFLSTGDMTKREYRDARKKFYKKVKYDWLQRMAGSARSSFIEKMSLFWHGHFACSTNEGHLAQKQLLIFREHGLGNFRDLLINISEDPAMMKYLNLVQNKKGSPNENYARELLELFTLGEGNYTEQDIREAARAFTGRNFDPKGNYRFIEKHFDNGKKTFLGKTGNFNAEKIIDIILEQKQCAYFISKKVYAYFVNTIIDEKNVEQLAKAFFNSNYDITVLMKTLLESDWFYAKENTGNKIKSPIQLLAGLMKTVNTNLVELPKLLLFIERFLGQELFKPPSVKGWDGGRSWITASTMVFRLKLFSYMIKEADTALVPQYVPEAINFNKEIRRFRKVKVNYTPIYTFETVKNPKSSLSEYLSPAGIVLNISKSGIAYSNEEKANLRNTLKAVIGLPEFQLG